MKNKFFKLVRKEYYRVEKDIKEYFFLKRYYTCAVDGEITTNFITPETYYENLEKNSNAKFFEIPFSQTDRAIQQMILDWELKNE